MRITKQRLPSVGSFCMVHRVMSFQGFAALASLLLVCVAGCDEFNARRAVKRGNALYGDGKFTNAITEFEAAVKLAPQLDVAHHNLALANQRLFKPGVATEDNKARAAQATLHFQEWLKKHPGDNAIRDMMTQLWVNSGDYKRAIGYWEEELKTSPDNVDVMKRVAGLYFSSGDWKTALDWFIKIADSAKDNAGKIGAYRNIGNVAWKVLKSDKTVGDDRLYVADLGIHSLEKVLQLETAPPGEKTEQEVERLGKHVQSLGLIGALYNFRALAHGTAWGATVDRAAAANISVRAKVITDAIKAKQPKQASAPAAEPAAAPAPSAANPPSVPNAPAAPAGVGG